MKFNKAYLLLILLFTQVNLFSQIEDTAVFNTFVYTAQIKPTKLSQSVNNIKIITTKTIEKQGSFNLKDVLIKELNIRIGNDNILGSSLSLQGISGQNIKILLDGVPITGRENGNIDLNQINLSNIERIEIIEGPLSVIYGTDALGGVINLISKKMSLSKPSALFANAYYETTGQYNFGGGGILKIKDIDFGASLHRNFFEGFTPIANSRVMTWKPKQQVFGNFNILNEKGNLRLRFKTDIFNEKIENRMAPVINSVEAYGYDEYYITNRIINSLNVDYKFKKNAYFNSVTAFSFYQRDMITFRKDLVSLESKLVENKESNNTNSFLTFMSRGTYGKDVDPKDKKIDNFSYQLGYDINLNSASGTKIESAKGRLNDFAFFACAEYKPTKTTSIKPGFRAAFNSKYSAPFIPSLQLMFGNFKNAKDFSIRMAYGRGFRAPSLKELYLNFVDNTHNIQGNEELKPELSDNYNLALKYKLKIKKNLNVFIENSYFYNKIYNQIAIVSLNPIDIVYTYQNIDNFNSQGTSLNFSSQLNKYNVSAGMSYNGIYNNAFKIAGEKKYFYSPEFRTQFGYTYTDKKERKTNFSVYYKYNGKTIGYSLDFARKITQTYTQGFSMLDVTLNRSFFKKKLSATVGCKNLLNVTTINSVGSSASFHGGGGTTMPISIGRSLFFQFNINL